VLDSVLGPRRFANPKSAIFTRPSRVSMMLPGFTR